MTTSDISLWRSPKTLRRLNLSGEPSPRAVQIAGSEPEQIALAAKLCVDRGAQIIDINMGCPAKKVCNKAAGSALLSDERLVGEILDAVVGASEVPVTLKIRTGPDPLKRNAVAISKIAELAGIAALAIHGRTRAEKFQGDAEYETIGEVKSMVDIPVLANGDVDSPAKALEVLARTGADGLMIGRPAQGNPWIFREILHFFATGEPLPPPSPQERCQVLTSHLEALYDFYGEYMGCRIARKHVGWYLKALGRSGKQASQAFNRLESREEQLHLVQQVLGAENDAANA